MPMQIMDLRLEILIGPSIWLLSWVSTPKCLPAFLTQTGFKYFCDVLGSFCRFLLSFHNKRAWRPPEQPWTGTFRCLHHCGIALCPASLPASTGHAVHNDWGNANRCWSCQTNLPSLHFLTMIARAILFVIITTNSEVNPVHILHIVRHSCTPQPLSSFRQKM